MSSIKDEPTKGESPVNGHPPLPHNESTNPSTVKCEWSLKESCACADGKCEDCQASDKEDEKDDISLTMTLAAASPLNERETDETEFHPPEWEDCEEADDTGAACDAALEDVKPVFGPGDDTLADGPVIEEVNPEEIKGEINDNVEMESANDGTEMQVEASQMTVHVDSVHPLVASRGSTRPRERLAVNVPAVEDVIVKSESEEANLSSQLPMDCQVNPLEAENNGEINVNVEKGNVSKEAEINEETEEDAGPIIEEVNPEEMMEENIDNVEEEGNACEEMHVEEASQETDHVNSLSHRSTQEGNGTLTAQAVDEMLTESEAEENNHQLTIIQQANTAQRNQEVIANNEGNRIASTEPDEEEEADQAGATVSSVSLRRSTRVRKRLVNYSVLSEAEEEVPQDDPDTGTSDSEEGDSDGSETEIDSELETDDPNETEASSSIGVSTSSSDGRHSRKAFPCQFCGKGLSSRQSARLHEETVHQSERPRPFACSVTDCGKAFLSKVALEVHTRTHSGSKPFTCATCGETFNQKGNLKRHKMTHTDARPYVCAVCGKTFKRKQDLDRHSLLHSALKPCFTCADCGVSFSRKDYLKVHRKVIIDCASRYTPSERRPFACTVAGCGRAFQRKSELKIHLLTHSGAKAFKCTVCGGTFTRKGTLQKHSRDIHGI